MAAKKGILIFSGNNQRAVIAFCRVAEKNSVPILIISSGTSDTIYDTIYSKYVVHKRESRALNYEHILSICNRVKAEKNIDEIIILPSTEFLNRFLLNHKKKLESNAIIVPLVDKNLYELVSDKSSFSKICSEKGFTVPQKIPLANKYSLPFVVKPKKYFSSKNEVQIKPQLITNENDLKRLKDKLNLEEHFLEEYIGGDCYYLLFYISKVSDKKDVFFSQKNLVQQAEGGSMIASISSELHNCKICQKYLKLLRGIGFFGLVMIELKYTEGAYYMIEANPRLWGPSQLFVDANIPIFEQFLSDLGFHITSNENEKKAHYFWNGGIVANMKDGMDLKIYEGGDKIMNEELSEWKDLDVYNRPDTKNIFIDESKM